MNAKEMRRIADQNGRQKHFEKAVAYFDERIRKAAEEGRTHTVWDFGSYYDKEAKRVLYRSETHITEEDGKAYYKNLGYTFRPTGVIGGVMQRTEEICW